MAEGIEIGRLGATELVDRVRSKDLSPVEITEAVLARMECLEPRVHAFCAPAPDYARARAKQIENIMSAGDDPGPLAGVPVSIKDLIFTKSLPTVLGSAAYEGFVPDEDDVVVERLEAAGAVIIGKTNVSEFGYSGVGHNPVFETTRNPWNTEYTPGGSSAGAGAAVASGMGPLAIGSDGGGSIRIPASLCGVFGMKASMGRIPLYPGCRDERYPGASSWETLEHIGPLARSVRDAGLMLSVLAGPDPRDRHSIPCCDLDWIASSEGRIKKLRVAYSSDLGHAPVDPEVRELTRRAAKTFESDLGCHVEDVDPGFEDPMETFAGLVALDSDLRGLRSLLAPHGANVTPQILEFLRRSWTVEELTDAVTARKAFTNQMARFMKNYDLLLTPTLGVPAFAVHTPGPEKIGGRIVHPEAWQVLCLPANMTGQPAASLPVGWTEEGLPVGLQIVGGHLNDALVLSAAAAFEAVHPWRERWPPLLDDMGL